MEITSKLYLSLFPDECTENSVEKFGYDRTMRAVANTINEQQEDGQFHRVNRERAKHFHIPDEGV